MPITSGGGKAGKGKSEPEGPDNVESISNDFITTRAFQSVVFRWGWVVWKRSPGPSGWWPWSSSPGILCLFVIPQFSYRMKRWDHTSAPTPWTLHLLDVTSPVLGQLKPSYWLIRVQILVGICTSCQVFWLNSCNICCMLRRTPGEGSLIEEGAWGLTAGMFSQPGCLGFLCLGWHCWCHTWAAQTQIPVTWNAVGCRENNNSISMGKIISRAKF